MNYAPHHTAISVRNLTASLAFYETFGYEQVHRYDEPDGSLSIVHLKLGSSFLEIVAYVKNQALPPLAYSFANNIEEIGVKHIALSVSDIEASLADLRSKGLATEETTIIEGRTKIRYFFIQDPDGVWVEVVKDDRYS